MIRLAKPSDINAIVLLGVEALKLDPYDFLRIDQEKIRKTAVECVSSAKHFVWVSEIEGEVVGVVGAMSYPFQFYERSQCSVIMAYCKNGGDGGRLIKKMFDWYKSRPMLLGLEFTVEKHMNQRLGRFLESLGMEQEPPAYSHYKGRDK